MEQSKLTPSKTQPETQLITLLKTDIPVNTMLSGDVSELRLLVHDIGKDLTVMKAAQAPKVFELKKALGEEMLVKLVCVVLKSFCESVKAKRSMDSVDIIECAEDLISTYTHDSVKDFVMALKIAKKTGHNFYENVNQSSIMGIISEYMEKKAIALESEHQDTISMGDGSVRTEAYTIEKEEENRYNRRLALNQQNEHKKVQGDLKEIEAVKKQIDKLLGE